MFWSTESAFEEVRRSQRELHERAARAQLLASARRQRRPPRPASPGPFSRAARRLRANLDRP